MLDRIRLAAIGKMSVLFVVGGTALGLAGCFHEDEGRPREDHAGWHERGSYGHDYDHHNDNRANDYRDHDYR
jgi:hypothetical protein